MNAKSILKSVHAEKWLRTILVIMIVISIFGFSRSVSAGGSTRISGVGFFAEEGDCTDEVVGHEGE